MAAGALAVSLWHVTLSRWGWDEVLLTTLAILVWTKLHDGTQQGDPWSHIAAGMLCGLALYGYVASRLLLVMAVLFLFLRWAQDRKHGPLANLSLFSYGFGVAAAPRLLWWWQHPDAFLVRVQEVSIVDRVLSGEFRPLLENLRAYALMFHWTEDPNPRHNLPGLPMVDPVVGLLFLIGVAVCVVRWRVARSQILLLWLSVGLLGGVLSDPIEAPHAYRTGMVAPACMLFAGIGWELLAGQTRDAGRRLGSKVRAGLLIALLVGSAGWTYWHYFVERPRCPECWDSTWQAESEFVRRQTMTLLDAGVRVLLDESLGQWALRLQLDELLARRRPDAAYAWVQMESLRVSDFDGAVLLVDPAHLPDVEQYLQGGTVRELDNRFGQEIAVVVSADPRLLEPLDEDR
jgi:hypothetical protein